MAGTIAAMRTSSSEEEGRPAAKVSRGIGPHSARACTPRGRRGGSLAPAASRRSPRSVSGQGFDIDQESILAESARGASGTLGSANSGTLNTLRYYGGRIPDTADVPRTSASVGRVGGSLAPAGKTRYYAVKIGHNPGIYMTWTECSNQVHKFPGAIHQSFGTRVEAYNFIHGTRGGESLALAAPATQPQNRSDPGQGRRGYREYSPITGPIRRGSQSPRRPPEPRIFMQPIADLGRRLVSGIPSLFAGGGDPVPAARGRNRSPGANAAPAIADDRETRGSLAPALSSRACISAYMCDVR